MRLIDADRFVDQMNEELFSELIKEYGEEDAIKGLHFSFRDCISNIECQPTVDAVSREKYEASEEARDILVKFADNLLAELKERVEVTRCKDCKHWCNKREDGGFDCCTRAIVNRFKPTDFCSYGERKQMDVD